MYREKNSFEVSCSVFIYEIYLENTSQCICLYTKVHRCIYIFRSVEISDRCLEKNVEHRKITL